MNDGSTDIFETTRAVWFDWRRPVLRAALDQIPLHSGFLRSRQDRRCRSFSDLKVVLIGNDDVIVHSVEFRFDGEVTWVGTTFDDWSRDAAE